MNFNLRQKMLGGFLSIAATTGLCGGISWVANHNILESFNTVRQSALEEVRSAQELHYAVQSAQAAFETGNKKEAEKFLKVAEDWLARMKENTQEGVRIREVNEESEELKEEQKELVLLDNLDGHLRTYHRLGTQTRVDQARIHLAEALYPNLQAYQERNLTEVKEETGEVLEDIHWASVAILVSGFGALLLAVFLGFTMASRLTRPLHTLGQIAKAIGEGQLDTPITIRTGDEIEELAKQFAQMGLELKKSRHALLASNDSLDRRVQRRTLELTTTNDLLKKEVQERLEAQERIKRTAAKLEHSNAELQDFASIASHDLQEPLRKVRVFGERLQTKCETVLGEEGRDYLNRMLNATMRMQSLINDLLSYSRVTSKGQSFVPVDLAAVIRDVLVDLEIRLEQTGGQVTIDSLPTLDADPLQMRQLFQNLIGNALKFKRPDTPPRIRIAGKSMAGNTQSIEIVDNGIGFEPKYADRIFKVFERLHAREEYEGTGIGLAICRKIVERHGGSIRAQSTPGEGTTFSIQLPLHPTTLPQEAAPCSITPTP